MTPQSESKEGNNVEPTSREVKVIGGGERPGANDSTSNDSMKRLETTRTTRNVLMKRPDETFRRPDETFR